MENVHICSQADAINHLVENNNKLSIIITGNGHPEKGLAGQVAIINERQSVLMETLSKMEKSMNGFYDKYEETREIARTAISAVEKYKLEEESYEQGIKDKEERDAIAAELLKSKRKDARALVFNIITTIITLAAVLVSIYVGRDTNLNTNEIKSEVRVTNDVLIPPQTRGGLRYIPPIFRDSTNNKK